MVPSTGSARSNEDSPFKDHQNMLERRSSEKLKSWMNRTITHILRNSGAMDLINQSSLPNREASSDAPSALTVETLRDKKLEERKKEEEDTQSFKVLQGEIFNGVVKTISPGSVT